MIRHRVPLVLLVLFATGCGSTGPPPTGDIEGRVIVCEPRTGLCITAEQNISVTLAGGPSDEQTIQLSSELFRFSNVEVGTYTLDAEFTGGGGCVVNFDQAQAVVREDETTTVTINGRGAC